MIQSKYSRYKIICCKRINLCHNNSYIFRVKEKDKNQPFKDECWLIKSFLYLKRRYAETKNIKKVYLFSLSHKYLQNYKDFQNLFSYNFFFVFSYLYFGITCKINLDKLNIKNCDLNVRFGNIDWHIVFFKSYIYLYVSLDYFSLTICS